MPWRDEELESRMGLLLRAGVLLAGTVMLIGGALYLVRHGDEIPNYRSFHGVPPEFKTVGGIWSGLLKLQARSIIQFGVLLMIATPVLRVAFAILAFALERDWLYTVISGIVLCLLTYALLVH